MIKPLWLMRVATLVFLLVKTVSISVAQYVNPGPILLKSALNPKAIQLRAIDSASSEYKASTIFLKTWLLMQFQKLPGKAELAKLHARGIELHEYIPENTYLCSVKGKWSISALKELGVVATIALKKEFKKNFDNGNLYAQLSPDGSVTAKYHLQLLPGADKTGYLSLLNAALGKLPGQWLAPVFLNDRLLEMDLTSNALETLLDQAFVLYAMPAPALSPLNGDGTDTHFGDLLQNTGTGGAALSGRNVVLGLGDNGRPYHIDNGFYEEGQPYNGSLHATHVAGTMKGAGIINPALRGYAYRSTMLVDFFNNIIFQAPTYYAEKRMVLTNNSYGAGSECMPYSGQYSGYCGQADQQLIDYPALMHVFAAGNSGNLACGLVPVGYRSIDNAFQAAKNVLTVGGTYEDGIRNKYSKGPVVDGRIKPEISAVSMAVNSTLPNNRYGENEGTSMSAPQVTGALALLYERYRQLNADQDPGGDLMKAIVCNTATDIGTKGVDFANGFGWLNALRALEVINNKTYFTSTLENEGEQLFEIPLDREVYDFKIMLYWHDRPPSFYTSKNLVNDLDLTVLSPDGTQYDPLVLDTSAAGILLPATMGKDHLNNIEQVVLDRAMPGRYTIKVKGYKIPFGSQPFRVVYTWKEKGLRLLQPAGGENWKRGENRMIHWQDAGREGDRFLIEFSPDGGANFTSMGDNNGQVDRLNWTLPAINTHQAIVRITNQATGERQESPAFTILPEINFTLSSSCQSAARVRWTRPAGIDSFAVLRFVGGEYIEEAITTDTSFLLNGLRTGMLNWITLQPIFQGQKGERSIAKSIQTPAAVCAPDGAVGDLAITEFKAPLFARAATSNDLAKISPVQLTIKNNGAAAISDTVFFSLLKNEQAAGRDTLVRTFAAGQTYTWTTRLRLSATPGESAELKAVISSPKDTVLVNNTYAINWRYLANPALVLPFSEDFSNILDTIYQKPGITGVFGVPALDLNLSSSSLKIMAEHSADHKGLISSSRIGGNTFQLTATYNLSDYQTSNDIRLKLGIPEFDLIRIEGFVRGSDTSAWITLPLVDPQSKAAALDHIDVSAVLAKAAQQFSSSFQLRLVYTHNSYQENLLVLNELKLFRVESDLSLVTMWYNKQFLTDGDQLKIIIGARNNRLNANGSFTLGIRTPDNQVRTQTFNSLDAQDTAFASFEIPVQDWPDAEAPVLAWVYDPADDNRNDDSVYAPIAYARKISDYPYLEGFENGKAGWGSTYIYELASGLGESVAPFRAAGGREFWGTRWVNYFQDIGFIVSSGYLVSPLFDLRNLQSPHLSMSVNPRLCEQRDSVFLEYSADTGRTWQRLVPAQGSTNWYSGSSGNAWLNCGTAAAGTESWHVASVSLPTGIPSIQLRIFSRGRSALSEILPRSPGGFLLDDVHVFDLRHSITENPALQETSAQAPTGNWSPLTVGNRIGAAVRAANGLRLSFSTLASAAGDFSGNKIMPRRWIFSNAASSGDSTRIRLYFTHAEVSEWLRSLPCDTCTQPLTAYDLDVFRYAGPPATINERLNDNRVGFEQVWLAGSFRMVPYESGYYAEIPAEAYGEFYIGRNTSLSDLELTASRPAGKNEVLLQWVPGGEGPQLVRYELEKARRSGSTAPVFRNIASLPATSAAVYAQTDRAVSAPDAYYYRVKLVYSDGSFKYSMIRTISFETEIKTTLFPNPAPNGAALKLLVENLEGQTISLWLYDAGGRFLWEKKVILGSAAQWIGLKEGTGALPAGVYLLKISNGQQKKSLRLVISGN